MRSVFVSACGDPFILLFTYELFKKRWYSEADEFLVCLNNNTGVTQEVISEILSRLSSDKKVSIIYHPVGIGNGRPITEMSLISKADNVVLLEDDFFIFESDKVDNCFEEIEENKTDIIGSPRYTYGEVADVAKDKFKLDYMGYGDRGFGWWPTGFFCKRKDLLKTDMDFGSTKYSKGKYFKELDHTFKEDNYTDTFTWASIQLRSLGLRSKDIPQFHADPYEVENYNKKQMNWINGKPYWLHGGSLSAGWNGYLSGKSMDAHDDSSLREMETRCALWTICAVNISGFEKFKKEYQDGIHDLIEREHLDWGNINKKINIYKELMRI